VVACDAGRFGLKTWLRRRWCPRGSRPPWVVQETSQWLWLYLAVEPLAGRLVALLLPGGDSACFSAFLQTLRAEVSEERVGVVLDNAPSHRSHQVVWPEDLVAVPLPAYSPESNPAQQVIRYVWQRLANQLFDDLAALQEAWIAALQDLWAQPTTVVRLTAYPWWRSGVASNVPLLS
jgi:transposase